nr:DUF6445 family protein [Novosphingobium sp.]
MTIGLGGEPLVVIDDFFPDPDALRAAALAASFVPARNTYPGVRAPLPDCYWSSDRLDTMSAMIEQAFGLAGAIAMIDASFSIVTTPADQLSVAQRLPHCDAFVPNQIALVHYLSLDCLDGTAFYRHRSTGFETISEQHRQMYFAQVDFELRHLGMPAAGYIVGDTPMFERIASVEGRFNRALLYRGKQLHSGAIGPGAILSDDPGVGRLTVTAFFTVG